MRFWCTKIRDSETTVKIKLHFFGGGGGNWGQRGKSPKTLLFIGNATTIKIWNCKFDCWEILLSLSWPSNPCFCGKKARIPRRKQGFSSRLSAWNPWKRAKTHKKARKAKARKTKKARTGRSGYLCVLSPALNVSENSCFFPCLDKALGKRTIPKITRNGQKKPNGDWYRLIGD